MINHIDEGILHEFLADLERLVQVDSDTYNRDGLSVIATRLHALFEKCGLEVERLEDREYGPTLIGRRVGGGNNKIVLLGHMDTVFPPGTVDLRPFCVKGRRAYGPGIIDMKSGLLLGCYALNMLRSEDISDYPEICFVCNSDEEVGSPSSRTIIESVASGALAVLVLERAPSMTGIISSRMGVGTYEIGVSGRSAHAGAEPEHGKSAVLELAHKIISLKALEEQVPGVLVNIGVVDGGVRPNVVAERATARVDVRMPGMLEVEEVNRRFRGLETISHVEGTLCRISGRLDHPPFETGHGTAKLVELAREIACEMGIDLEGTKSGGASDGNFTAALGIPTLDGLGPVGEHPHSADENLDISSIMPRLVLLTRLIRRLARQKSA